MPRTLLHLLSLTLLLLLTQLSACSQAKLPPLPQNAVIVAFGDSLTAGYGVRSEQSYPVQLQILSGRKVINAGLSGEKTDQGRIRLQQLLDDDKQIDLLILFEGGNDILQKRPYPAIQQNLAQMIELAQAKSIPVLLIGVPEKKLFSDSAPFYAELAEQYRVPLEQDIVGDLLMRPSLKSDYVHFNAQGYRLLAEAVYKKLQQTGALDN